MKIAICVGIAFVVEIAISISQSLRRKSLSSSLRKDREKRPPVLCSRRTSPDHHVGGRDLSFRSSFFSSRTSNSSTPLDWTGPAVAGLLKPSVILRHREESSKIQSTSITRRQNVETWNSSTPYIHTYIQARCSGSRPNLRSAYSGPLLQLLYFLELLYSNSLSTWRTRRLPVVQQPFDQTMGQPIRLLSIDFSATLLRIFVCDTTSAMRNHRIFLSTTENAFSPLHRSTASRFLRDTVSKGVHLVRG